MSNSPKYKVGELGPDGNKIKYIYGQTDTVLVFLTENKSIAHYVDVPEITPKMAASLREFDYIHGLVVRVHSKTRSSSLQDEMANAFYNSLTAADEAKAVAAFAAVRERTEKKASSAARIRYATAATISTAALALLAYLFYEFYWVADLRIYGACGMFAAIGAFASVILRIPSIPVDPFEDQWIVSYQGAFRIVIGVIFAAFLVVAAKANLVAGIANTSATTLLTYAFICGFSERFAPELLASFEKAVASARNKPHK